MFPALEKDARFCCCWVECSIEVQLILHKMKRQSSRESKVFSIHGEGKLDVHSEESESLLFPLQSTLKLIQDNKFNVKA